MPVGTTVIDNTASYMVREGGVVNTNTTTVTVTVSPTPTPTPGLVIAGITTEKKVAGAIKVAGITELPFTGSNLVLIYAIAILMIISGTAILASSRKVKVKKARL